jgi:hypothetical protein
MHVRVSFLRTAVVNELVSSTTFLPIYHPQLQTFLNLVQKILNLRVENNDNIIGKF